MIAATLVYDPGFISLPRAQTAHLGGKIRHSELKHGGAPLTGNEKNKPHEKGEKKRMMIKK
jgi:hypothetical protein